MARRQKQSNRIFGIAVRHIVTAGLCLAVVVLGGVTVYAYEITNVSLTDTGDFIVSPGKTELTLEPGEQVTRTVEVTNRIGDEGDTQTFRLSTEDFTGSNVPGRAIELLGEERGPHSLKDFIQPEIPEFDLERGEKITLPVTISVPEDAEPGGRYGALITSTRRSDGPDAVEDQVRGGAQVESRIGSLFLVRVAGEVDEEGTLTEFGLSGDEQWFYQQAPSGFEAGFENSGNVHLTPWGMITVTNVFGQTIDRVPVDAYFVLPDSTRYRQVSWDMDSFLLGRYTAELEMYPGYGSTSTNQYATVSFWVLPWKVLLGIFGAVLVIFLIGWWLSTKIEIRRRS